MKCPDCGGWGWRENTSIGKGLGYVWGHSYVGPIPSPILMTDPSSFVYPAEAVPRKGNPCLKCVGTGKVP